MRTSTLTAAETLTCRHVEAEVDAIAKLLKRAKVVHGDWEFVVPSIGRWYLPDERYVVTSDVAPPHYPCGYCCGGYQPRFEETVLAVVEIRRD